MVGWWDGGQDALDGNRWRVRARAWQALRHPWQGQAMAAQRVFLAAHVRAQSTEHNG